MLKWLIFALSAAETGRIAARNYGLPKLISGVTKKQLWAWHRRLDSGGGGLFSRNYLPLFVTADWLLSPVPYPFAAPDVARATLWAATEATHHDQLGKQNGRRQMRARVILLAPPHCIPLDGHISPGFRPVTSLLGRCWCWLV